jgi:hypothetical protein
MNKKIVGMGIVLMFFVLSIPQIEAVGQNDAVERNRHVFGLCYIEIVESGEYEPAGKSPFWGCGLIFVGRRGSTTTIYDTEGGEQLASFEGVNWIYVFLMHGYFEITEEASITTGNSFGVIVLGR